MYFRFRTQSMKKLEVFQRSHLKQMRLLKVINEEVKALCPPLAMSLELHKFTYRFTF